MRILTCEQGSPEWHIGRSCIPTASMFEKVMPKKRKFIDGTYTYMYAIAAEIITGQTAEEVSSKSLSWGKKHEPKGAALYEAIKGVKLEHVGICIDDELRAGGSPDGLVGEDGMIEIKCPYVSANHAEVLFSKEMPAKHVWQVQGNMMINGRKWCDFVSYDPRAKGKNKIVIVRVERDDDFIDELRDFITAFNAELDEKLESIGVKYQSTEIKEAA